MSYFAQQIYNGESITISSFSKEQSKFENKIATNDRQSKIIKSIIFEK